MCTVTVRRDASGLQVTMNRDEARTRPPEEPPRVWPGGGLLAPRDAPPGGGTWIGVSARRYWACLLNRYDPAARPPAARIRSRGTIIPRILSSPDPVAAVRTLDVGSFQAFRLLLGAGDRITEFTWDGEHLADDAVEIDTWLFRTSSSWQAEAVTAYRQAAFDAWIAVGAPIGPNGVPELHLHQEAGKAACGVLMQRPETRTTSITQLSIHRHGGTSMRYWPVEKLSGDVDPADAPSFL